jgi:hypothetical protein
MSAPTHIMKNIEVMIVEASLFVRMASVQERSKVKRKGPHKSPNIT